jgi:predicted alpha/beta-hydrolase family hydrolase
VSTSLIFDGPENAVLTVALAHGAGAGMDSPFLVFFATGLAQAGYRVARFEFPYMAERRAGGPRRPPNRTNVLSARWRDVIAALGSPDRLVIGGKSLGGRMASLIADEARVAGLVCLGYPFHPPGQPERTRVAHLQHLRTPTLILQGSRDPFGSADDVAGYSLAPSIGLHWIEDGDHGFRPRAVSGRTERANWEDALGVLIRWLVSLPECPSGLRR